MRPETQRGSSPGIEIIVPTLDPSGCEGDDTQDAGEYYDDLFGALVDFLERLAPVYNTRIVDRPGMYPDVMLEDHVSLPLSSGECTEHRARVRYNRYGGGVEPGRVDVYYGGELDATKDDSHDPKYPFRHGHVVVQSNPDATEAADRWSVVLWLAPGYVGWRMVLVRKAE